MAPEWLLLHGGSLVCFSVCWMSMQEVESQLQPDERALAAAAVRFGSPDITPALEVKEYHRQLAESLQVQKHKMCHKEI